MKEEVLTTKYDAILSDEMIDIPELKIHVVNQEDLYSEVKDILLSVTNAYGSKLVWNAKAEIYKTYFENFTL